VDGKFVKVRGYEGKIPLIYGVDYLTHDIPTHRLVLAESYESWLAFFTSLRLLNYPLQGIVCDDNINIRLACLKIYPKAVIQLCQTHYVRNIKNSLNLKENPCYLPFMEDIRMLFKGRRTTTDFGNSAFKLIRKYQKDPLCMAILTDIHKNKDLLLAYTRLPALCKTNNLIECFNSHIQQRVRALKGFKSFKHAASWLNGLLLRRRFLKLTDCKGKFRHLNGKRPIDLSKRENIDLPTFF